MLVKVYSKKESENGKFRFLISLILACTVTMGLIKYEEYTLSKFETENVLCVSPAVNMLEQGTVITKDNVGTYFSVQKVPKTMVTKNFLTSTDAIVGKKTSIELYENEIVTAAQFSDVNEKISKIVNPVETSINAADLSQLVGGILREGDTIDISVIGEENNLVYELRDVYVAKAFNSSGELIRKNSGTAGETAQANENAMLINIIISKSDEEDLNRQMKNGQIRVSKTNDLVNK